MPYRRWSATARLHADRPAVIDESGVATFADLAAAVARTPPARGPVIARTGGIGFLVEVLRAWRDGQPLIPIERDAPEPILARPPPPGTCLVKYTPGASGIPRAIFLTADQVIADGDRLALAMGLSPEVPTLAAISLAHSYGFSNGVLPLLLHGVPLHLAPVPFPRPIEAIFQCHPRLVVPAVPSIWRAWHRAGILRGAPIALALSAGAPLSLELETTIFEDSGLKIHNFYGASECGGIAFDASHLPRTDATDVGTPLPGVTVRTGSDGRLEVASSGVATGYDQARSEDGLGAGVYRTRDLGFIDGDGHVRLTGTLGGAINVSGRKVSPSKVEAALLATGLVRRVRVFGTPSSDAERVAEISAEVALIAGGSLQQLKFAAMERLQGWELPRHWHLRP